MKRLVTSARSAAPWVFASMTAPALGAESPTGMVGAADALQVIVGLLLVLLFIAVLAWIYRRSGGLRAGGSPLLRVMGTLPLGTRERLVLVRVNGVRLLLGVAPGRVSTLYVLGESEQGDSCAEDDTTVSAGFRQLLARATNREKV